MEKKKSNHKRYRFTYIKATVGTLFLGLLFLKGYTPFEETGENFFHIQVNGQDVGTLGEKERIDELLLQARKNVASGSDELVFMKADMVVVGEQVLWGEVDREEDVAARMEEALRASVQETLHRSYTLKVDEYTINLASLEDVQKLLQAAIDKYGNDGKFTIALKNDEDREFSMLTAQVESARPRRTRSGLPIPRPACRPCSRISPGSRRLTGRRASRITSWGSGAWISRRTWRLWRPISRRAS